MGRQEPQNVSVDRVEDWVEIRIDEREDLALPFKPEQAMALAMMIQQAAADAKKYQQMEGDH